ncbi:MAG: elongation factor G [Deltaproteobacteria bacterium]|nr:elongation factor G [Deltaproteobacteria bacterium]
MHKTHGEAGIHNIAVTGKDGVGKSQLVDALLSIQAKNQESRIVEYPEEKNRNFTIYNRFYHFDYHDTSFNLIDTPGNTNFLPKVNIALHIASGTIFVVSGEGNVEAGFRIWESVIDKKTPKLIFVNRLDMPEANMDNTLYEIEQSLSMSPLVLYLPWYDDGKLIGVIDILDQKIILGKKGKGKTLAIPEESLSEALRYKEATIEKLAELDDELLEHFVEGKKPSLELLKKVLSQAIRNNKVTPVLVGSAKQGVGVDILSDFLVKSFPPHSQGPSWLGKTSNSDNGDLVERRPLSSEPFSGLVFKTLHDRYMGKLNFLLVISGVLKKGMKLLNSSTNAKFPLGRINVINAENLDEITEAYPGDIVVIEKEDHIVTNQTVCDPHHPMFIDPIPFPVPRCTFHLELTNSTMDNRIMDSLHKVIAEDPSLRLHKNEETNEILLSGMGMMHLEITREHLKNVYDVEVKLSNPFIAYHETITKKVTAQGKHKKQSGGHGQYGDVHLQLEPLPRGSGFEFVNGIVGGVIPKTYIPAVEKGVLEAMKNGCLGGFPVVDIKVTLFDGSHHTVDSSEHSFFQAGIIAVRKALPEAKSVLLEPIMEMEIDIPEDDVGTVSKNLASRRAKVLRYYYRNFTTVIVAEAPLAEFLDFTPALRGMTQGMGLYTMSLKSYEVVTSHLAAKILSK